MVDNIQSFRKRTAAPLYDGNAVIWTVFPDQKILLCRPVFIGDRVPPSFPYDEDLPPNIP